MRAPQSAPLPTVGLAVTCQRGARPVTCQRGAPPIVASGMRSMLYLWDWMYMMGTPGIFLILLLQTRTTWHSESHKRH